MPPNPSTFHKGATPGVDKMEIKGTKKGQAFALDTIINGLVVAAILLIVGVYLVTVIGNQFVSGSSTANVNNTVTNVTNMFATVAPLLVVVGIIAFIAIVLMFVRTGIAGGRGGM